MSFQCGMTSPRKRSLLNAADENVDFGARDSFKSGNNELCNRKQVINL